MGFSRLSRTLLCVGLFGAAGQAVAAPEPLIVTKLPDPELTVVAASSGTRRGPVVDTAVLDFSRAIDQQLAIQQQQIEARCRSSEAAAASAGKRWAWAAACRYQRR